MKYYCFACGAPNDHLGVKPKKCEKCGANFETESKKILAPQIQDLLSPDDIQEEAHGDSYTFIEEPEPISQQEIEKIFLANAHQTINLRDLMTQEKKKNPKRLVKKKKK